MWEDISYNAEQIKSDATLELLYALRRCFVNGDAVLRSCPAKDKEAFKRAMHTQHRGLDHLFQTFVSRPSLAANIPELKISQPLLKPPQFTWRSAFGMEGELTAVLRSGGAYEKFLGSVDEARQLTRRFMEDLLGSELQNCWVTGRAIER